MSDTPVTNTFLVKGTFNSVSEMVEHLQSPDPHVEVVAGEFVSRPWCGPHNMPMERNGVCLWGYFNNCMQD